MCSRSMGRFRHSVLLSQADLHVERDELAAIVCRSRAGGDDLALLRLLLGGVRDDATLCAVRRPPMRHTKTRSCNGRNFMKLLPRGCHRCRKRGRRALVGEVGIEFFRHSRRAEKFSEGPLRISLSSDTDRRTAMALKRRWLI